jgi:hypothetical protein
MTAWFGAVWSRTLAESDKLIFGRARVNIIVSFAVGFFTGAVWCLLFYGPIVLGSFS